MRPFGVEETHGMLRLPGARVRVSSQGLNWKSLYVSSQTEEPFSGSFFARDPLIIFHRQPVAGYADRERLHKVSAPAGSVRFVAPGAQFDVVLSQATETTHLYLRREIWNDVAIDLSGGSPAGLDLKSSLLPAEPLLFALSDAAVAAAQGDCTDPAFSDHLSRCIASHVITAHLGLKIRQKRVSEDGRPLSREVSRAMDFIEANADRSIGLPEIASAACRSPSHLARVFAAEVGMPPHRYLIAVRVKRAQQLLARTEMPIAEIALECGFTHQEHLTRLFRRYNQTTPAAYRRSQRA